jgi:hypothetical protein
MRDFMNGNDDKQMAELIRRRKELDARIEKRETEVKARARKADTRHKVIVGACVLADIEKHPETLAAIEQMVKRAANARDREFLKTQGWRL